MWLFHFITTSNVQGFRLPTSLPMLTVCFDFSHPSGCKMLSHCGFDLGSLITILLNSFSCACWPFVCLLWRNVYSNPLPISKTGFICLFLLLICKSSLCILDTRLLSDKWFANIFSHSLCYFFLPHLLGLWYYLWSELFFLDKLHEAGGNNGMHFHPKLLDGRHCVKFFAPVTTF